MKFIPAVDLMNKKAVRLEKGSFDKVKIYSSDVVRLVKNYYNLGFKRVHLIDLDGAKTGRPVNLSLIKQIAPLPCELELGGGIRTFDYADYLISKLKVNFVIIGTMVFKNSSDFNKLLKKHSSKVIVDVAAKNGRVYISGWRNEAGISVFEYLRELSKAGVKRVLFTDILRDGALKGVNLKSLREVCKSTSIKVIASGGVASKKDYDALKKLKMKNLEGVVCGKAVFENTVNLKKIK